jgi:hypothetical protein
MFTRFTRPGAQAPAWSDPSVLEVEDMNTSTVGWRVTLLALALWSCASSDEVNFAPESARLRAVLGHPGEGPWERVPEDQVREVCRLDPEALARADRVLGRPWAAIRYGRLCHSYQADSMVPSEPFSVTKLLGATVAGAVAYRTRDFVRSGPRTGPFSDEDRVDAWLDRASYNRDAQVAHVLAMVAQSQDLRYGAREMEYDYLGVVQLDSLSEVLNTVIEQDRVRLGANLERFTQRFMFEPLGMRESVWSLGLPNKTFAWGWNTTLLDMARLGQLILRRGVVHGNRLVDEEWIYRMTHPAFEDANTGMGYCTWLNAAANFSMGTMPTPESWADLTAQPRFPGPCAPVSMHREHPHGLSQSTDCNYGAARSCDQQFDVGVWQSFAGWGTVIQGHPGLDLVLVAWQLLDDDFFAAASPGLLWDNVRPAVVSADPRFQGNEPAFCAEYGANRYAPDLVP